MEKDKIEYFNKTVKRVLKKNKLFVQQKYLYHYTDIVGLKGIIQENELWLSERNYMNDVNDEKFIKNYIKKLFKDPINWEGSLLEKELIPSKHQYIFSTSIEKDLIHQWTYYGSSYSFCIEFDRKKLIDLIYRFNYEHNCYYGPVLYENKVTENIVNEITSDFSSIILTELNDVTGENSNPQKKEQTRHVYQYFYSLIKQNGHYCEKEYRFLLQNEEKPLFRIKNGLFIPYIKVSDLVGKTKNHLPINKIIIGPNNREEISKQNLKFFLEESGYEKVDVEVSNMSIR